MKRTIVTGKLSTLTLTLLLAACGAPPMSAPTAGPDPSDDAANDATAAGGEARPLVALTDIAEASAPVLAKLSRGARVLGRENGGDALPATGASTCGGPTSGTPGRRSARGA